jgi:4-oxalocrotonate tautomerase
VAHPTEPIAREVRVPLVEIHLLEGRSPEVKRQILASVTEAVRESSGAPLDRIRVWIHEMPKAEYMVGGVTAAEARPACSPDQPSSS